MDTHLVDNNKSDEVSEVWLTAYQSLQLEVYAQRLAAGGGPQAQGSQAMARKYATNLLGLLSPQQCRELIRDNRRLLFRLFGYSQFAQPVVLNEYPLLVRG